MNLKEQRAAAAAFAAKWADEPGYEKGQTAPFWLEFLSECLGVRNPNAIAKFEKRVDAGFPDVTIADTGVIIEQKSKGIDLDKTELRQGRKVTPFEQALSYVNSQLHSERARYIITCNFEAFRIHDLDRDVSGRQYEQVELSELEAQVHRFDFITDPANSRIERERVASIKAGELIGELHREFFPEYIDPEGEASQHAMNVLCVRLVFLLFAEDVGLFGRKGLFSDYMRSFSTEQSRRALLDLFEVLDTPEERRDPYLEASLKAFPYVDGGLFRERIEVPNFTDEIRFKLLFKLAQGFDWSKISPTVFGGVFEGTLNPDTRAQGGMHYTSVENIHRVIDPLFLDALTDEFDDIIAAGLSNREKSRRLRAFQDKLATLAFLDPACGSGNFLTETYLCLRRLENRVLMQLEGGQATMGFAGVRDVKVSLGQLYGIEINDFAVRVATTALWIAELQSNLESEGIIERDLEGLPLKDSANIVLANALRIDWNDVLPAEHCSYVLGNPPFVGYSNLSEEQKQDRRAIFGGAGGMLDYVACWYRQAADYIAGHPIHCAFVSTNSICQGQQVEPLWRPLFEGGAQIGFAHRSFVWNSEATNMAHVHVVIVGFSRQPRVTKLLFSEGVATQADHINAYLIDAPDAFVSKRSKPICDVPEMAQGFKPADGGHLLLSKAERDELLLEEPGAARWIRPFSMGAEFINGTERFCLWLPDITAQDLKELPLVRQRIERCREWRSAQIETGDAFKLKDAPHLLRPCGKFKEQPYIGVPKVSSERRKYIPMGFVTNGMIPGDMLYFIPTGSLYHFGIMTSQFHNAWMRVVAGRLEMRYRYSNTIVYNNFVWPNPTASQQAEIERCAQAVLDAREGYPASSLADLYDPDNGFLHMDLVNAHRDLDRAVEVAYGVKLNGDEQRIVAHLFERLSSLEG